MALKYFLGGWLRTNIDVVSFSGSAQLGSEEYASHLSSSFQHYEIYNIGGGRFMITDKTKELLAD